MTPALQAFAENLNEFHVRQTFGVGEPDQKISNYMVNNTPFEFEIQNSNKEIIGLAQEEKKEELVPFWVKNYYMQARRAMSFTITNESYDPIMYLKRSSYILNSTTLIYDERQVLFASIKKRFNPFIKKYDFLTENNQLLAFIHAPIFKIWTFPIYNPRKRKMGQIKKRFPTAGEFFTKRETFKIDSKNLPAKEKLMALVASIILSIEYFF